MAADSYSAGEETPYIFEILPVSLANISDQVRL
jgi:hypothetical protein